jgi:dTDP-glucose 4,6-dehydratase
VLHLGALIAIPYSYRSPLDFVHTNVDGTAHLLAAAQGEGVERFIQTSTSEVYGSAQYVPMDEQHPLRAQSPYAATKIGADQLALSFHRAHGLPVTVIRPFNCFGERQSARAIVPTIVTQVLTSSEVRLGTLAPRRDLTYVADTADAFVRAAETPETIGKVMNIGSGRDVSIEELARMIFALTGKNPALVTDAARIRPPDSEVDRLKADSSLAKQLMAWEARTSLEDGLSKTIAWVGKYLDEYRVGEYLI